jgi:MOSC domain-containing protein YiiM
VTFAQRAGGADIANAAEAATTDAKHLSSAELEAGLDWIRAAPADHGRLELIVRRPAVDLREVLDEALLTPTEGVVGDNWRLRKSSSTPDGAPDPDRQLTLVNARLISLVAVQRERWALAGDQLFVDFDLSVDGAPAGTRLEIGSALIELTEPPHLGCAKFVSRYGTEAMRFVNSTTGRSLRLRGAHAKVIVSGTVHQGDAVTRADPAAR